MKKFLLTLSLLLSATTIPLLSGMYNYTPNRNTTVQIGGLPSFDMKGMVMQTILHSPNFEEERLNIKKFLGIPPNGTITQSYQTIIASIHNAPSDLEGLYETIEAIEKALMNYVHTQEYLITNENKWLNIFVTGIRWSWVNPISWFKPSYWYSDNSQALQVCMQELSNLAIIAKRHSSVISYRIQAKVESYLHWRRNLAIAITAYLAGNLIAHGWQNSSLKMIKNGGLSNTGKILEQSGKDIHNLTNFAYTAASKVVNKASGCLKPIANIILHGDQATNNTVEKKENAKDSNNKLKENSPAKIIPITPKENIIKRTDPSVKNNTSSVDVAKVVEKPAKQNLLDKETINKHATIYNNFKNYNKKLFTAIFKKEENDSQEESYYKLYPNSIDRSSADVKKSKYSNDGLISSFANYFYKTNDYKFFDSERKNKTNQTFQAIKENVKIKEDINKANSLSLIKLSNEDTKDEIKKVYHPHILSHL